MSETFSVKAILSADDGSFRSVFNNAQGVLSSFANSTGGLTGKLSSVTSMVKGGLGFGVLSGIGQSAFGAVSKAISGVTSNLGGAISRVDTLKQFPRVMEMMDFKGAKESTDKLKEAIDGLPTTLDGITKSAQTLALTTGDLSGATDTAIALNNAFLMSGSSAAEAERGLTQYVQMLSTGKVDQQSWISLCQTMGPALNVVAESFGYAGNSAKNDLYEALKSGKITFDDFNKRLAELNGATEIGGKSFEGFAALAKEGTKGIGTSIENLKTTVIKQMANTIQAFDDAGLSIADSIDGIKSKINEIMTNFIGNDNTPASEAFNALVKAGLNAKEALVEAFHKFSTSPAIAAAKESIENIANNLGVILPNMIHALEPVLEGVVYTVSKVFSAISTVIREVTSDPAFQTFAQNIGKAIEKVGDIASRVINHLRPFITAILDAANEVMAAFGKAIDAIVNSASKADVAGKMYSNFQKVLGFVKDALIKVAQFLEKHHSLILWLVEHLPQIVTLIFSVKAALLVMEKVKGFMALTTQVKNFITSLGGAGKNVGSFVSNIVSKFNGIGKVGDVAKSAFGNVEKYMGNTGTTSYTVGQNITKTFSTAFYDVGFTSGTATGVVSQNLNTIPGAAQKAGSGILSSIGGAFSNLASKVGGALGNVASSVGSVISTIGSVAGPIAMVAGPAIAAITGIVNAIIQWREKQKEAGADMVKFTEEQQAVIDKNKELTESYDEYRKSASDKMAQSEAEVSYVQGLRDEYNKLLDTNGQVIKGKEDLAAAIQEKIFSSMGIERSQIEDLKTEYASLIDENGKIKEGYEDRAKAIETTLSEIVGHEVSGRDQVLGINNEIMGSIDQIIEKKRLQAQVEAFQEAAIQADIKRKEAAEQYTNTLDLLAEKQKELAEIEQGTSELQFKSNEEKQGAIEKLKEEISDLEQQEKTLSSTVAQCETDKQKAMEGTTIAMKEMYDTTGEYSGAAQVAWEGFVGIISSAEEAVRKYGSSAREVLEQQVTDAQTNYEELKTAHEKGEEGITQAQVDAAEKRLEYAREQAQRLKDDKSVEYEASLQADREKYQKEYEEAQKAYDARLKQTEAARAKGNAVNLQAEQQSLNDAKAKWEEAEKEYENHLTNKENQQKTSFERQNADAAAGQDKVNTTLNTKMQEGTSNAGKEGQNTNTAYTNGLFGMIASTSDIMIKSTNAMVNNLHTGAKNAGAAAGNAKTAVTNGFNGMESAIGASGAKAMLALQGSLIVSSMMSLFIGGTVGNITRPFQQMDLGSAGSNAMIGMYNGMNAKAMMLYNLANTIASNIAATMAAALQIHSPSRLTTKYGQYVVQGLINGMDSTKSALSASAKSVAAAVGSKFSGGVISKVNQSAKKQISKLNKELNDYISKQNKSLNDYASKQNSSYNTYVQQQKATAQKYLAQWNEYSRQLGGKLTDSQRNSIANKMNSLRDKIIKINENIDQKYKTTVDNINNQTKKVNENIKSQQQKTKESISKLNAEITANYVSNAKKRVEQLKKNNQINEAQEISYWQTIVKACKKGSEAYEEAFSRLSDAKTALQSEVASTTRTYVSDVTKAFDELEKSIDSRAKSLAGHFKLTDETSYEIGPAKSALITNLRSQIMYMNEYDKVMDSLQNKLGSNNELYKELQSMDMSSLGTLKEIDSMTSGELKTYARLYNEKVNLARSRAEKDNIELEKQVKAQVTGLTNAYRTELNSLGVALATYGSDIAKMFVSGINTGLAESKKGLDSNLQSMATTMVNTVKNTLQIHSPSRVTTWIGEMFGKGLVNGIESYDTKAEQAAKSMAESTAEQIEKVSNLIKFPDASKTPGMTFATQSTFTKDENYNYNGTFQATIEVPVNLNGREVSRLTVNTDGEEQYFHQKRYGR